MRIGFAGLGAMGLRPGPPGYEESVEQFVRRNLVRDRDCAPEMRWSDKRAFFMCAGR
jgi:hypothetical protein